MRKINLFIGMVLTTVLLAACGQHNKPEFKGDISGENDLEQTQSYFTNGMHEVTKCPTGYYYMSEQEMAGVNLLKYYDNEEQKSIVLCNKPQCEHNSKECMAYLDMSEYKPKIYYYNSFIYMIRMNGDLEQISADGSERIVLGNVCNSGSSDTINVSFNGDTAYISKENEEGINGDIKVEIYAFNIHFSHCLHRCMLFLLLMLQNILLYVFCLLLPFCHIPDFNAAVINPCRFQHFFL